MAPSVLADETPAAQEFLAAHAAVFAPLPDLAVSEGELKAEVVALAAMAGEAPLVSYVEDVLGDVDIISTLSALQDRLAKPYARSLLAAGSREALRRVVNDMLLPACLVPTRHIPVPGTGWAGGSGRVDRRAIHVLQPAWIVVRLKHMAKALEIRNDPIRELIDLIGYTPDQPLPERLARLALLNIQQDLQPRVAADPLFTGLVRRVDLLPQALYAGSGAEAQSYLTRAHRSPSTNSCVRGCRAWSGC